MKNKLTVSLLLFLLLVPFRLPISILFVNFFEWAIIHTSIELIPHSVLATNVIITKLVYNMVISSFFVYNIEMFSREKIGRKARSKDYTNIYKDEFIFWWIIPISIMLVVFLVVDGMSVYDIFFY